YGGGATRAQTDSSERGGGYESQFDSRHVDSPIEDGSKLASFSKVPDGKPWESVRGSDGHDAPVYHTARSGLFNRCIGPPYLRAGYAGCPAPRAHNQP